jgi:hypothetical protein
MQPWMKWCNYLWFSDQCVLHFFTSLNERGMSVPLNKIMRMLKYNTCCCFYWPVLLMSSYYAL